MTTTIVRAGSHVEPLSHYDPMLPIGTKVYGHGRRDTWWRKTAENSYLYRDSGGVYTIADLAREGYRLRLLELPDGTAQVEVPQLTVEQVKWEFWLGAQHAIEGHGYQNTTDVANALQRMVGELDLPIGPGIKVPYNNRAVPIPNGTVVYAGHPSRPDTLRIAVRDGNVWRALLGSPPNSATVHVATVPGVTEPPEWATREGTDEDAKAILAFQARAWNVGWALKRQMGWCETYERIMGGLGVDESAPRQVAVDDQYQLGDEVTPSIAVSLPNGSLLRWVHRDNPQVWSLLKRDDTMMNRARTRRVMGTDDATHQNVQRRMTLVALPQEQDTANPGLAWEVPNDLRGDVLRLLPPGSVFLWHTQPYIKANDGNMTAWGQGMTTPNVGIYNASIFTHDYPMRVVRVP